MVRQHTQSAKVREQTLALATLRMATVTGISEGLRPAQLPKSAANPASRYYRFRDADPMMLTVCNLLVVDPRSIEQICEDVHRLSGSTYKPSPSTLNNWLNGRTRRPQHFTMGWILFALGYEFLVCRIGTIEGMRHEDMA